MPTKAKKAWIKALSDSGVREIEVGSFVPPKLLPQLADTAEIVEYSNNINELQVAALVPNFIGARNAIEAGTKKITLPLSVSETHSLANLKMNHRQVFEEVEKIAKFIKTLPKERRPHFEGGLSTAFGCTLEGQVSQEKSSMLVISACFTLTVSAGFRTNMSGLFFLFSSLLFCLKT